MKPLLVLSVAQQMQKNFFLVLASKCLEMAACLRQHPQTAKAVQVALVATALRAVKVS